MTTISEALAEIGRKGGKSRQAQLTRAERVKLGSKGGKAAARALGSWGRSVRAAKGWDTRRAKGPAAGPSLRKKVLEILKGKTRVLASEIAQSLGESPDRVSNALSSLRSGGHVRSEQGGGKREKRWSPT